MQFVPQKLRTITIFECLRLYILWFYCRLVVKVTQKKIFQNSLKDIARVQRHNISQWNTLIKSTLQFLKFLNFHNTIQSHFIPFDKQMQLFYLGTEPAKNMVGGFGSLHDGMRLEIQIVFHLRIYWFQRWRWPWFCLHPAHTSVGHTQSFPIC